jgi:hypothetical protein
MSNKLGAAHALAFMLLAATASCGGDKSPAASADSATTTPPSTAGGERVLFIGNSLTEGNDLPLIVEALSRAGGRPFAVEAVTVRRLLARGPLGPRHPEPDPGGGYRFVVLQQGPSALAESRVNLREWTRRFDTLIRQAGARTALYMVWPESYRPQAFPDVSDSYRLAAEDVGGILLPAGDAWTAAWRQDADFKLYGSDGFHPTLLGSYLAACAIYGGLSGASPVGLPSRLSLRGGRAIEVSAAEARVAQAAAAEALR